MSSPLVGLKAQKLYKPLKPVYAKFPTPIPVLDVGTAGLM